MCTVWMTRGKKARGRALDAKITRQTHYGCRIGEAQNPGPPDNERPRLMCGMECKPQTWKIRCQSPQAAAWKCAHCSHGKSKPATCMCGASAWTSPIRKKSKCPLLRPLRRRGDSWAGSRRERPAGLQWKLERASTFAGARTVSTNSSSAARKHIDHGATHAQLAGDTCAPVATARRVLAERPRGGLPPYLPRTVLLPPLLSQTTPATMIHLANRRHPRNSDDPRDSERT